MDTTTYRICRMDAITGEFTYSVAEKTGKAVAEKFAYTLTVAHNRTYKAVPKN